MIKLPPTEPPANPLIALMQSGPEQLEQYLPFFTPLDGKGRCSIYDNRPQVCRKPQIFPYLLEKEQGHRADGRPVFRLRNTLLAVMDCPYVQQLQHDIALYAAASELELVFRRNKA